MFEWFFGRGTTTYNIKSDIFYPNEAKTIFYKGPKPTKILFAINGILKKSFRIRGSDTYEDEFKWDVANPVLIKFLARWRIRKSLDARSTFYGGFLCQGEMDKKTEEGWVKLVYKGHIDTQIPYTTPFDKALKHLYFHKFHIKQLRVYTKRMTRILNDFDRNVRELYKIHESPVEEEAR